MDKSLMRQFGKQSYRDAQGQWDEIVIEAPLLMKAGNWQVTNLRTPGNDADLLRGFLLSEGFLNQASSIKKIIEKPRLNDKQPMDSVEALLKEALVFSASQHEIRPSCGLCGHVGALDFPDFSPLPFEGPCFSAEEIFSFNRKVSEKQTLFASTGACHAAALFDENGHLLALGEDVGRHNAVDKAMGKYLLGSEEKKACVLWLSGRCGLELIRKAARLQIPVIVSVSGITSLSFDLAKSLHITLIGFSRKNTFRLYHDPGRIKGFY
jgi:FdhD protein